ncbi:Tim44/TimA family putative adaptor protein [Methylocapsa acidiphila]|uniref:Tim44/TimA family putative adaptor protein n=1 Tax=Methylocapsa acidiphila TaxID=133552 RepID=UPI0003FF07E7|nr:Tim44/TimA family putative adaptor protein [Methylocapsa acidiphila]
MQDSFDATTIIFALLAVFVIWKLRSILGTRSGTEKPPSNPFVSRAPERVAAPPRRDDNIVVLPGAPDIPVATREGAPASPDDRWKGFAEPGSKTWTGLDAIAAADPSFAVQPFLDGAKAAYEMIVSAFAAGNRPVLENLLAKDVYDSFSAAIGEREKRGEKVETTFVSIDKAVIDDAELSGRTALITLRYAAQIITATRGQDGAVIEGSADKVIEIKDIWTYSRDVGSRDPNWRLTATRTGS